MPRLQNRTFSFGTAICRATTSKLYDLRLTTNFSSRRGSAFDRKSTRNQEQSERLKVVKGIVMSESLEVCGKALQQNSM